MTEAATPLLDRLEQLSELKLDNGGHSTFEEGHCAMELVAWLAGEEHTDSPSCTSPVLTSFLIRLNDALPDDLRQKLKPVLPKVVGTRDGLDEQRGWMITDWSIRTALPIWLEVAGVKDAPKQLRALPEITSSESFAKAKPLVYKYRDEAWERRRAWREKLVEAVKEELKKRGIQSPAAAAAAAADADAAAAAAAVAAADADADADAVAAAAAAAVAAADAVADAAAAAVAAAAADAAAVADAGSWRPGLYSTVYNKLKPIYREKLGEKYEPTQTALLDSALELVDRMCELKAAA